MGDSETVVAQTSTVMEYTSTGYTTTEYSAVSSNVTPDSVAFTTVAAVDTNSPSIPTDTAYPLPDGSSLADGNACNTDPISVAQEPPVTSVNESIPDVAVANTSENLISQENVVPDSAQVGCDSSVNGNGVVEAMNFTHTGSGENGNASDDAGGAAEQPYEESSALSAEEERLWSILKANSLDFNAWTALIEETEKVAEDNILKIRKVYDTFLAEFPLCYGYWKKYADHEARLGNIDKVVEVYERAVVAVTYSVDIWLHYCMFAISTYGDPDTVRSMPATVVPHMYGGKVVKLYERCLIACANYPEYWIRYVLCMEASGSLDLANNALTRATQVFVKRQPEIHLFAARFKEQTGDVAGARAAYQLVHSGISPGLLEAVVKHANMEHRLGNLEDAFSLYEQAIATEKGKEQSQTLPMLFVQYARFFYLVAGNAEKAREVLVEAIDNVQLSKPLLEALIHLEAIQSAAKRIDYLDSLVEKFILPILENPNPASTADREELSGVFLEFLNLFGDAQSIKKAEDRHAKLFLRQRYTSELRKRHAEDFLASDKAKVVKSYAGVPSTAQSLMGAYPTAQNQWTAGYGLQPQAWSQAAQAGQQWNPSYAQQAGYGGYTGYGSGYTHPQMPSSTAQSTAYGTYPPTYPVQATPQQSYAQPAAAAVAFAPTQQQAPAQQAYYGTYY